MRLVPANDPILKKKVPEFTNTPDELIDTIEQMFAVMQQADGIGLSANQVGLSLRLFIMKIRGIRKVVINPEILEKSEDKEFIEEGCLSFGKLRLNIRRPIKIKVKYLNLKGETVTEELDGVEARCFLHEFDHLNGITFDSKVDSRQLARAKMKLMKGA